ncbi:hypothetical protein AX17_003662 [Amanita inopinata Kibby_2008]|nr:hypothetical protein AX17_003662 [Amanita inopinata Kibby_2008]
MIQSGAVYHIVNAKSGTALDLSGTDNVSLIGWPSHDGDNQKWHIEERNGRYTVRNVRDGKYVGVVDQPADSVSALGVNYEYEWEIRPDDEDPTVFRFFVPGTRFNLDLTNFGSDQGNTPVAIWGKWEGRNQCWRLQQL